MTMMNKLKTYIDVDKSNLKAQPNTDTGTFEFNIAAPGGEKNIGHILKKIESLITIAIPTEFAPFPVTSLLFQST